MRITVRNLLLYIAWVGLTLGLARLPPIMSCLGVSLEITCFGFLLATPLRFWWGGGMVAGMILGTFALCGYWEGIRVKQTPVLTTLPELRAFYAAESGRLQILLSHVAQLGAAVGGTVGLILGQRRYQKSRRLDLAVIEADLGEPDLAGPTSGADLTGSMRAGVGP